MHDRHNVAEDPQRDDYWCFTCKRWFPAVEYTSPYEGGKPPLFIWHDVPIKPAP